jgi:aminopeptidase YwaD
MFKQIFKKLEQEISGQTALNHVANIASYHRIQASPGMRAACLYAVDVLKSYGVDAKLNSYPANGLDYAWSSLMFREWNCEDAWLKLVEPVEKAGYLARFNAEKIHVIQRSVSTPPEGIIANVIVPSDKGEEPDDYEGLSVVGKFVLTNGDVQRVHEVAVNGLGAAGIICDAMFVRPPNLLEGGLDDALKYTSYWWGELDEPGLGFVVTPRTGRMLRKLVAEGKEVKVHGFVDSDIYDGYLDDVVATIPGVTDEEIIVVAHICHPQPSANDNASGSGAVIEVARAIHKLVESGELPKPMRTIRFTLVPEMSGTYAYLNEREEDLPKMVAAINLDMVGENQDKTGSVLVIHKTPDSLPSYVNAVAAAIFKETQKEFSAFGGAADTATFRHAVASFSGGSDHYIYSDPSVGVPCPMVIQWPDKFYHTSWDTVDKVSPHSLERVALLTATYAYFLANAGKKEVPWIASQVLSREKQELTKMVQDTLDKAMDPSTDDPALNLAKISSELNEKIIFDADIGKKAIRSILRLSPNSTEIVGSMIDELDKEVKIEQHRATEALTSYAKTMGLKEIPSYSPEIKKKPKGAKKIPVKLYRGPFSTRSWISKMSENDREALRALNKKHKFEHGGPSMLALYWTDGVRSIEEISHLVELESGETNLEYLVEYYSFLEKMGLINFNQ